ncbi:MAG: DUF503 domain-containing protein [Synergistaceae bacterium]|jgi:uncharacterized protein YlxP (DUF503 family)|nr:DUF503 domain-containing protein [Synergistaceae bacterium]
MIPWLCVINFSIEIDGAGSLKDRRQVVRSLLDKIHRRFNASCADLGPEDSWGRADIAVSCVGSSHQEIETRAQRICSFAERSENEGEFILLDMKHEVFSYGDF